MDYSKIYQYRFDELLKKIKYESKYYDRDTREGDQIIDICGNVFREYHSIVSSNESWVIYTIDKIITNIFDWEGIDYSIPEYEFTAPSGRKRKNRPFSFVLKENNRNIGYVFLYNLHKGLIEIRKNARKFNGIDSVRYYFLQRDNKKYIDQLNDLERKDDGSFLEFYSIKEFFDEKFGNDEFPIFMNYVDRFNERARNLIGFKTISIPTKDTVKIFKSKIEESLKKDDYASMLPDTIDPVQKSIIVKNYVENKRFLLMTGNADFADSFISSEWYYGIHTVTGAIDQTGLVTGYLKSVEQLLFALIKLRGLNKKRWIKINPSMKSLFPGTLHLDQYIDLTDTSENYADTTLGSLIHFIKNKNRAGLFYNADLFEIDNSTIQSIVDALYDFKDTQRNDHLHKDNLYTSEEIDDIREKAKALYCLLIGSFRMNGTELTKLIAYDTKESLPDYIEADALLEIINEWATPILLFDMPKTTHTVAFNVKKFDGEDWNVYLQGLKEIPKDKYKTIEWNYKMIYSSSMTRNMLTWKSDGEYTEELDKLLEVLRSVISSENELAALLKQYDEVVVGNFDVIEVLYSKKQNSN